MLTIKEIHELLQKMSKVKISQADIATALGTTRSNISLRIKNESEANYQEIRKIEDFFGIMFNDPMTENARFNEIQKENISHDNLLSSKNCTCGEQFDVPYWEGLPDNLKRPKITSIHTDRELIENDWQLKHDNLRVIPMKGDSLQNYWYPMRHNDILAFDITNKDLNNDGIFVFTTNNGENIYIRKLNLRMDGNIDVLDYKEPTPVIVKTITPEMAKEVDFQIIGRVFKNISLRI